MHELYVGIGSNLGDRQANILAALQRLRARAQITAVSAFYESEAAHGAEGPAYLNIAAALSSDLDAEGFKRFARDVELAVGRARGTRRLAPRPIDVDLLVFDGAVVQPHLDARPYNVAPLAEIAPHLIAPPSDGSVRRRERGLRFDTDRQSEEPEIRLSLNRAGVSGVRRVVHLEVDGRARVYNAEFTMVADLAPDQCRRSHVALRRDSRRGDARRARARRQARRASRDSPKQSRARSCRSQRAIRADVRLRAEFGLERWTPVSGKRGEETYTLVGIAHADESGTRRVVGVEAEGMTACPCAQAMVREHSLHELVDAGFSECRGDARARRASGRNAQSARTRRDACSASASEHANDVRAEDLVEIVENSMSSETYDLLKRPDEFFVVNKAHHNPKFVEDVVRGILARALDMYADFGDDTFVFASQVNDESIHKHDAFAEAFGLFGELREELRTGAYVTPKTDLAAWLRTRPSPVLV